MFKPSSDRQDYSELLSPPYGYETTFAVGTTYSLDLDALVGVSIALGLSESIDSELKENPIYLLEALQRTADKLLIFCEKGQIKVPPTSSVLYILLEKMVVEVALKNNKSFHSKFWLVKYVNTEGVAIYRCLTMSRNLTFDRSWDVVVSLDGQVTNLENTQSKPVSDFIKYLSKYIVKDSVVESKKKDLNKLARDVMKVNFEMNDKKFTSHKFLPLGIKGYDIEGTGLLESYHETVIMSPFLSLSTIDGFNKNMLVHSENQTLITRKAELGKLKIAAVTNFNIYVLKDIIVDGEEAISESTIDDNEVMLKESLKQDIHAKLYLRTKYSDSELYLGSVNASHNAFYGNVEFLIKLSGKRRNLNVDLLTSDLFGEDEKDSPFEQIEVTDEGYIDDKEKIDLEKVIKVLCRVKSTGMVTLVDAQYKIDIYFENLDKVNFNGEIKFRPLLSNKEVLLSNHIVFGEIDLLQISEFYVLTVSYEDAQISRLIRVPMDNIPEGREQALVKSIIKNQDGFVQYLAFLLEGDYLLASLINKKNLNDSRAYGNGFRCPAIYEKLLKTAVHSPEKFNDIERLMVMISDEEIIPPGFKALYDTFKEVVVSYES